MEDGPGDLPLAFSQELTRRRLLAALVLATAASGLTPDSEIAAQTPSAATPSPEEERATKLTALSKELCGGGNFSADTAKTLLDLLDKDAKLSQGLSELLAMPSQKLLAATPVASANANAASETILLYWYTGSFNGNPVPDRSADYTQLLAWQAMYTPAWTTSKLYGGWVDAPAATPQVPENPPSG